jgi:hypothetical protein
MKYRSIFIVAQKWAGGRTEPRLAEPDIDNNGRRKFRDGHNSLLASRDGAELDWRGHIVAAVSRGNIVGVTRDISRVKA